jgi:hypothetical protein
MNKERVLKIIGFGLIVVIFILFWNLGNDFKKIFGTGLLVAAWVVLDYIYPIALWKPKKLFLGKNLSYTLLVF